MDSQQFQYECQANEGTVGAVMNKNEVIRILRQYKKDVAGKYGITRMGLFGSVARDEATPNSDIDVFVGMSKPDLFTIAGIKDDLEIRLKNSVDIVPYSTHMNDFLKQSIDRDALDV